MDLFNLRKLIIRFPRWWNATVSFDDLRALLDDLGIGAAHIVGLSMGGRIALRHALLYPRQTLSLTLVDSALDGYAWSEEWIASLDAIEERARADGPTAANAMWLEHEIFTAARTNPECSAKLMQIISDCSGQNWIDETPVQGSTRREVTASPKSPCLASSSWAKTTCPISSESPTRSPREFRTRREPRSRTPGT